ncbi:MAG: hypothetical protein U0791_24345 [Gemmataceae bacterium]
MARTKLQPRKRKPEEIDSVAAVGPLVLWYVQAVKTLWELSDQASAVAEELRKEDSPWGGYVTDEMFGFCAALNRIVDHHLTPPFTGPMPTTNPLEGLRKKGGAA